MRTFIHLVLLHFVLAFSLSPVQTSARGDDVSSTQPMIAGQRLRFEHLTPEEGLPSLTARGIVQDQQGFMWFATGNGLYRYDGYTFKAFHNNSHDPRSLSDENIKVLYEDHAGVLWVGTVNKGLNAFDRTTEQFTRYQTDPDDPHSLSDDQVNAIYEDQSERLWIATGDGLARFERTSQRFIHYRHNPDDPHSLSHNQVQAIVEDSSGNLWLGTQGGGLNQFDPATGQFTRYQHDPNNPHSLSHDNVWAIADGADGSLWVGTTEGLNRLDPATGQFTHYRHDPNDPHSLSDNEVSALYADSFREVWVGTSGDGLNLFDSETETFTHFQPNHADPESFWGEWVWSIYADRTGFLWIATLTAGVNRLDRDAAKFELYQYNNPHDPRSLSHSATQAIFQDHLGTLWVGTSGGGLNKYDPVIGRFTHYRYDPTDPYSLSHNQVFAIAEDPAGNLWVGTRWGLNRFDRESEKFARYTHDPRDLSSLSENWVVDLYTDRSGRLWVGTFGGGLNQFDPNTERFRHYQSDPANPNSLSGNWVVTIAEDPSGALWLGTLGGGLNKFDSKANIFTSYRHEPENPHSLSSDDVEHIYIDQAGVLWLATSSGLDKFDSKTETFVYYREEDGPTKNNLRSIIADEQGNLWLGTQGSGLARFDPKSRTFRNYDQRDGLQGNEFMSRGAYRGADGKLYFAGKNGLNAFYPDQLIDTPYIPPVVLTDFRIFNQSVPIGGQDSPLQHAINETENITLSYQQSVFSFEFAALNYRTPEKNQYAYKLEGFDKAWNYVDSSRRFATYTNLDPGTYTFLIKASNTDEGWNETRKALKITIIPPWWKTVWFYLLCAAGVLGIFGLIYRSKANQLHAERAAALALRESEERYRQLFELESDAILLIDNETGRILEVNSAASDLYGYNREELLTKKNTDLSAEPEDTQRVTQTIPPTTNQIITIPLRFHRKKDGTIFPVEITGRLFIRQGRSVHIAAIRDITERKQAEEALRKSAEQYHSITSTAMDGFAVVDLDGRLLDVNEAYSRMIGYNRDELLKMSVSDIEARETPEEIQTHHQKTMVGPQLFETRHRCKDGHIIDVEVSMTFIPQSGQMLVFLRNITKRKRAEEQIKNQNILLKKAVQEKQREMEALFESLLRQEKLATIGQMASSIAHELRNPLGAVKNSVFFLKRLYHKQRLDASNPQVKEHLNLIETELNTSERVIADLLQMTRMKLPQRDQTNLGSIIKDAVNRCHLPKGIQCIIELHPEPFLILADPVQLRQVFINLLTNAIQAITGDGSIAIRAKQLLEDHTCVIEVEDTGTGIENDMLDNVFEPLYTTKAAGTGLGLSICKQIIENHQGHISVMSQVGQGTTVTIVLPEQKAK